MIRRLLALISVIAVVPRPAQARSAGTTSDPNLPLRSCRRDLASYVSTDSTLQRPDTATAQSRFDVRFYTTDQAARQARAWMRLDPLPIRTDRELYASTSTRDGGVELAFGQPQLDVVTVAGFGAVETPGLYSSGDAIASSTSMWRLGQAVQVGYFYNGSTVPMNHEIACQKARNAAELAMQTIQAKIGG